jgi:hypothetical protein
MIKSEMGFARDDGAHEPARRDQGSGGPKVQEVVMRHWIAASMGVLFLAVLLVASSATVQAADKTIAGTVGAISPDSITINARDDQVKLVVDTKTRVVGTGVGTKTAEMKKDKKTPQIIDLVKTGDTVSVSYDETSKQAKEVRITKAAPAK